MNNRNFGMGLLGIVLSLTVLGCFAKGLLGKDHDRDIEEGLRQVYDMGAKRVQQLRDMGYTDYDIYNWAKMNNMYSEGMNGQRKVVDLLDGIGMGLSGEPFLSPLIHGSGMTEGLI